MSQKEWQARAAQGGGESGPNIIPPVKKVVRPPARKVVVPPKVKVVRAAAAAAGIETVATAARAAETSMDTEVTSESGVSPAVDAVAPATAEASVTEAAGETIPQVEPKVEVDVEAEMSGEENAGDAIDTEGVADIEVSALADTEDADATGVEDDGGDEDEEEDGDGGEPVAEGAAEFRAKPRKPRKERPAGATATATAEAKSAFSKSPARPTAIRLQKFLADSGVASRRASEEVIRAGRVAVNGTVMTELGTRVNPLADKVQVDGQEVRPLKKLYVAVNKPPGYTCTRGDAHAAHKVGELLPAEWTSLYSVGRLDRESEGLLFLTNDGDFCLHLTHPRYGVRKVYRATVAGMVTHEVLSRFRRGVRSEGELLRIQDGKVLSATRGESLVELVMTEGRNREIRRLFESEGFEVVQLIRTQIGPIKLGELRPGKWRTLTPDELKTLLKMS